MFTKKEMELIETMKKENPYTLSLKEWNLIKKKVKELCKPGIDIKFKKERSWLYIEIYLDESFMDLSSSLCLTIGNNRFIPKYTKEKEDLEKKIREIYNFPNVTYSERDLYTDYYGHYRFNGYVTVTCKREIENNIWLVAKELRKINESGFCYKDAERVINDMNIDLKISA